MLSPRKIKTYLFIYYLLLVWISNVWEVYSFHVVLVTSQILVSVRCSVWSEVLTILAPHCILTWVNHWKINKPEHNLLIFGLQATEDKCPVRWERGGDGAKTVPFQARVERSELLSCWDSEPCVGCLAQDNCYAIFIIALQCGWHFTVQKYIFCVESYQFCD